MSVKIDENPNKIGGDWHKYKVSLIPIESREKGKSIEIKGTDGEGNLELYGSMTLANAKKIYKQLEEAIKVLTQ